MVTFYVNKLFVTPPVSALLCSPIFHVTKAFLEDWRKGTPWTARQAIARLTQKQTGIYTHVFGLERKPEHL